MRLGAEAIYDLHSHSSASDGILSPAALVSRAKINNVTALALTDHDTTAGLEEAQEQSRLEGLDLIPGIEFSSQWLGRGIHIVGLNIDPQAPSIQEGVALQAQRRVERAEQIAARLAKAGVEAALEGARSYAVGENIGRPHFARYLVEAGYVSNSNQAFKKYLGAGKPGDIKQCWPEFGEVVRWITDAGGIAVLAHPCKYKMTRSRLCVMVQAFVEAGGTAIEVVSGPQTPNQTRDIAAIALKYDLAASCGSDFHSPGQAWQELGRFPRLPEPLQPVWRQFNQFQQ